MYWYNNDYRQMMPGTPSNFPGVGDLGKQLGLPPGIGQGSQQGQGTTQFPWLQPGQGQYQPPGPPPGQGQNQPPGPPPGFGSNYPPGPPPGQGQNQPPGYGSNYPPGPPPGQGQGQNQPPGGGGAKPSVYAVDPGAFRRCLNRYTRVTLRNGQRFWYYPTYIGRTSIAGYRWRNNRWIYQGMDTNRIVTFSCR